MTDEIHPSTQLFLDILDEMRALSLKKQADYGRATDPFANVRAAEDFGISPWIGAAIRINDKQRRIQKAATFGSTSLINDSLEDDFLDNAIYNVIALVMLREETAKEQQ
jgi:hypothetical protein